MKNISRVLLLVLGLAAIQILAACGSPKPTTEPPAEEPSTPLSSPDSDSTEEQPTRAPNGEAPVDRLDRETDTDAPITPDTDAESSSESTEEEQAPDEAE